MSAAFAREAGFVKNPKELSCSHLISSLRGPAFPTGSRGGGRSGISMG